MFIIDFFWKFIRWLSKRTPSFGGLKGCTTANQENAKEELFSNFIISTFPLWGGFFLLLFFTKLSIFENLKTLIGKGELFIYCTSILAPCIYIVTNEKQKQKRFPNGHSIIVWTFVIFGLSALAFAGIRTDIEVSRQIVFFVISLILIIVSVLIAYVTKVYENSINKPEGLEKQEQNFSRGFNRRRRQ